MKTKQATQSAAPSALALQRNRTPFQRFLVRFKKNWQLHLLMLLPIAYILLFYYTPMYGLQIAFRDFKPRAGIWGSEWVGLKHFIEFMSSPKFFTYVYNTLAISLYSVCVSFPIPVILALMLHVSERKVLKKVTQNVAYVPHFISVVVLVGILNQVLNPVSGIVGTFYHMFGGLGIAPDIRANPGTFRHLYVWSGIWQQMGWNTIIYVAALAGVSHELHEAAELDGASRWKRVLNVDLPAILPTVSIMLILRFGSIMSVGYEKVLLMQNDLNLSTSEVISTYVYKVGLAQNRLSFGTAVDLFNSVVNVTLLVTVNAITRKLTSGEQGLF
ncbi:MAG: sugar ABC transporter permease [Oscillospiraceae bacterium]|nr:sugar ABC transporter permease [Oscillospiraceae bacterium]